MPYISQDNRERFEEILNEFIFDVDLKNISPGELNYILSTIIWTAFKVNRSYTKGNELMGVLECVKQEFYDRQLTPYENEKRAENGDLKLRY